MANRKCKTTVSPESTFIVDLREIDYDAFRHWPANTHAFVEDGLTGPLYWGGSNLGLGPLNRRIFIHVVDSCGTAITTHSISAVLSLADYFADGDRQKLLGAAAIHFGLDVHALQGRHV